MESVVVNHGFWSGKRVFVTGHTGFKGSWLALWLHRSGADLCGYAIDPPTSPNLFDAAGIGGVLRDIRADVRDVDALRHAVRKFEPEVVFHLAAQPLVLTSHRDPVGTYAVNVQGTVNLLEATRGVRSVRTCIVVTSDKCYDLTVGSAPRRETDPLGGTDPYSSSKACAELVTAAYRQSFFSPSVAVSTARAGNVIGGGDWADNRLLPDLARSFSRGEPAIVRNPSAIRPWQHVLEPLAGYLLLAEKTFADPSLGGAWNFGPGANAEQPVEAVVDEACRLWGSGARWERGATPGSLEAKTLRLDATKAQRQLGWRPRFALTDALAWTMRWYAAYARDPKSARQVTEEDIARYEAIA